MRSVTTPSKEQVRAYMMQRGQAQQPPPALDEIRRQLGWDGRCGHDAPCLMSPQFGLFLPGAMAQLSALMAVEWLFAASGFRCRH